MRHVHPAARALGYALAYALIVACGLVAAALWWSL